MLIAGRALGAFWVVFQQIEHRSVGADPRFLPWF
jgi:hypothetical protein